MIHTPDGDDLGPLPNADDLQDDKGRPVFPKRKTGVRDRETPPDPDLDGPVPANTLFWRPNGGTNARPADPPRAVGINYDPFERK